MSSGSSQPAQSSTRVVSSGLAQPAQTSTRVVTGGSPRPVSTTGATRVSSPVVSAPYATERPAYYGREAYATERPAYYGRENMGGVIVEEFTEQGPFIGGVQAATLLTGDRLSAISARPGPDARIPYAPPTSYVPSASDSKSFEIDSVGGSES